MDGRIHLQEITPENVITACRLEIRPEQEEYVTPVAISLAEAYANPGTAWPRLVYDGDEVVAFLMGGFDPNSEVDIFRCGIWRLNVAAEHQGKGYGRFAVQTVVDEARRRGERRVTVLWKPGEHGPEKFYLRLGFRPTGQDFDGQKAGELLLD